MNNQNDTSSKDNILQTAFFQNELKYYGISGEGADLIAEYLSELGKGSDKRSGRYL